ncbi:MAG TPA: cysteine desulfurase-like protein [Anaerolineae bacterium]|nr:cysteine desulfurase-like protein [Anaerolineae bacterium]
MSTFNPIPFRAQFPALTRQVNGQTAIYLDGPGGTQVPQTVIDAISHYFTAGGSNYGGPFAASQFTDATVDAARQAMIAFYNAQHPTEIVFGQNMTSLIFPLSRALATTWQAGDEIILSPLDHDANVSPWLRVAEDHNLTIRWLGLNHHDCTLDLTTLPNLLNDKTRLVAVTAASNAVGSITNLTPIIQQAHAAGALVLIDAVHYAPHDIIDVQALDCDFLLSSAYKYFGPHTGILYGKYEHLDALNAYKVRPAPTNPPMKWETGTQSFESLAGVTAAVHYLANISGSDGSLRDRLVASMTTIKQYEQTLSAAFLKAAATIPGLRIYGITDTEKLASRTPTFAISLDGHTPSAIAQHLANHGIFVWDGHYYAITIMDKLGLLDQGGLVRIGFAHYNTHDELDRLITTLRQLTT